MTDNAGVSLVWLNVVEASLSCHSVRAIAWFLQCRVHSERAQIALQDKPDSTRHSLVMKGAVNLDTSFSDVML